MIGKLFNFIKAGGKTTDDIFDKDKGLLAQAGGWIGNAHFTQEERAEFNAELAAGVRKYAVETLNESTDRSKARREIALITVQSFLLLIVLACAAYPISKEWAAFILSVITSYTFGGMIVSITIFFFGSHAAAKWKKE